MKWTTGEVWSTAGIIWDYFNKSFHGVLLKTLSLFFNLSIHALCIPLQQKHHGNLNSHTQ